MLVVLALTLLCFVVAAPAIEAFLVKYPVGKDLVEAARNPGCGLCLPEGGRDMGLVPLPDVPTDLRPAPGNGLPRCGADSRW